MATGDQTLINFPRESTMKEISQACAKHLRKKPAFRQNHLA